MFDIEQRNRIRPLELAGLALVLGLSAWMYRETLQGFFVQDDFGWLDESRFSTFREYLGCFFRFSSALAYRPLSQETYFLLGQKFFGLHPFGFHVGSMLIHLAGAGMLYFLLRKFAGRTASLVATLFYAVHPAHSRSIGWIAAVPEPMALLFNVTAVLFFVRYDRECSKSCLAVSVTAMALGVMSKESILTVPLVLALYSLLLAPHRLFSTAPHFLIAVGYALARATSSAVQAAPYPLTFGSEALQNLLAYLAWAGGFTEVLLKLKLKWDVAIAYPALSLLMLAIFVVSLTVSRNRRVTVFALGWFLLALQPVLYFSQHIFPYYLAPSLAALALLAATLLEDVWERRRSAAVAMAVLLQAFVLWAALSIVKREVRWWNNFSYFGKRIIERMPEVDRRVEPGRQAYIFGFGEDEFGSMQNDAAFKAFGYSPVRFIMVGLDRETARQIRTLRENKGIQDYFCFVYSNGDFVDWTERFRTDPEPFILIRPVDYLENMYRAEYSRSPIRMTANSDTINAGKDLLELRLSGTDAAAIDLLYTHQDRLMPALMNWKCEPDGVFRVAVGSDTPRGWYRYRAIRKAGTEGQEGWSPVNVGIYVR